MQGLPVPTGTERKGGVAVLIATTRLSTQIIAGRRNPSLPNWKKANAFLHVNIRI